LAKETTEDELFQLNNFKSSLRDCFLRFELYFFYSQKVKAGLVICLKAKLSLAIFERF
jgi:hypothetical protein